MNLVADIVNLLFIISYMHMPSLSRMHSFEFTLLGLVGFITSVPYTQVQVSGIDMLNVAAFCLSASYVLSLSCICQIWL